MPTRSLSDGPAFERLDSAACWELLDGRGYGRICLSVAGRVQVVLTAYVVSADSVYFRAAAFGAVARMSASHPVTLQVDDMPADEQAAWSVTVTGVGRRVEDAATLADLWTPVRPHPWTGGHEGLWIELVPDDVQGQRRRLPG